EAYSDEVVSFGFWAGDQNIPESAYYSYAAPEPDGLRGTPVAPDGTRWAEALVILPYETVRSAADPRATLLEFLESAYAAGADAAGLDPDAATERSADTVEKYRQ